MAQAGTQGDVEALQEADTDDHQGTLGFEEFCAFYKMMSTRRDLYLLMLSYSDHKDHLDAADLQRFLEVEQKVTRPRFGRPQPWPRGRGPAGLGVACHSGSPVHLPLSPESRDAGGGRGAPRAGSTPQSPSPAVLSRDQRRGWGRGHGGEG